MPEPKGRRRARELGRDPEAPRPSLGGAVVDWMLAYLVHGPGEIVGRPFTMHADLERFVWDLYEIEPPGADGRGGGRRVVREAALVQPKGWAKSEAAGAVCAAEGLGPVRFDGWDAYGRPVAVPASSPEVLVFGGDEAQAGNTYGNTAVMLHPDTCRDALLDEYGPIDVGITPESSTRIILPDGGTIEKRTSRARSKEGGKTTMLVLEESHLWVLEQMLDLWRTGVRNVLKRPGTTALHVSNWYAPGEGSVLEELWGDVKARARGILWCGRTLPAGILDPTKPLRDQSRRVLRAALEHVYGSAASFLDLDGMIDYIKRPSTKEAHALRFYFNAEASLERKWTPRATWVERMAPTGSRIRAGERVGLGFSGVNGCPALVACRLSDRLVEPVAVWERDVDVDAVEDTVAETFERFRVARMLANPRGWRNDVDRWAARYGEKVVLRFTVQPGEKMAAALDRWETALHTAQVAHVGDEVLSGHVLAADAAIRPGTGVVVNIEPPDDRQPITAAHAALLAHEAACQALALDDDTPPPPAGAAAQPPSSTSGSPWRRRTADGNPWRRHGRRP